MENTGGGESGSLILERGAFDHLELRPSHILRHIAISVGGRGFRRISSPSLLGLLSDFGKYMELIAEGERQATTRMRELFIEFPDLWGYGPAADVMIQVMVPVAEVIRCSGLTNLTLIYSHKLAETEVQPLAIALRESSTLRVIQIEGLEEGMAEALVHAFSNEGSNLNLEKLSLKGYSWEGLRNAVPHLLKANILQVEIYLQPDIDRPEVAYELHAFPWEESGRALLQVKIMKKLSLGIWVAVRPDQDDVDSGSASRERKTFLNGLKKMWEASQQSPLINLSLFFCVQPNNSDQPLLTSVLLSLVGLKEVHLSVIPQGVSTCDDTGIKRIMVEVMDTLNQNEYRNPEICILQFSYPGNYMQMPSTPHPSVLRKIILEKLSHNNSIKRLTLDDSFFEKTTEEDFREVLKCLVRNSTLQRVDIGYEEWIRDGKVALIQEALQRNIRQAEDMSMMKQAGLQFSLKTAGRILLCGSPYAGKTRLTKTLLRTERRGINRMFKKGLKVLGSVLKVVLPRTRGIEVTTLRNDAEISITVWDLGGQWIFRALQDLLFPRTSHACIYLFVFSPVERERGKLRKKNDLTSALEQELKSWLRFIASNSSSAIAGLLPQVMVVISHKDKMPTCDRGLSWARSVVDHLKASFQGVVNLSSGEDIQFINCHDTEDVSALKEFVFRQMNIILVRSLVPSVGIAVTTRLTRRPREVSEYPVWSLDQFYTYLCNQNVRELHNISRDTAIGKKVLDAVVGYLHDVGSIIIISHLAVVDPNWLTEKFLGELFSHGRDFEAGRSVEYPTKLGSDGFVDSQTLSGFLATFVAHYEQGGINVSQDQLRDLLLELNLCFELEAVENPGNPRYFMPAVLGGAEEKLPARKLEWKFVRPEGAQHFGFRLQCDDRDRKCLTKSFFPTFQVKLRNYLVKHLRMDVTSVRCSLGLMMILEDGNEIFVESDELAEDHIDIMVRSSPDKKEAAIQFVEEQIIRFLHDICKSDFVGVSLSTSILRTECVVKLTPRDDRSDNQAISVRELEQKLEEEVKRRGSEQMSNDGTTRCVPETWIESCLAYEHTWPGVRCKNGDFALQAAPEPIKELLPPKVLNKIRKNLTRITRSYDWPRSRSRKTANEVRRLTDEVYEVYAPVSGYPRLEVVFVHGVPADESDPEPFLTTWSKNNDELDKCWLNTWLTSETTEDLRLARILTVTYDCGVRKTDCSGNMDNFLVAESLTQSLITLARVGQHDCPVVLVGHCLGGLVIKEVCCEASRSVETDNRRASEFDNFLTNVKGVFFYSTPHLGWSRNFSPELQMADMMESLQLFNKHTSRVNQRFEQLRTKYSWVTRAVGESNKTKILSLKDGKSVLLELVVEEASARGGSLEFCMVPDTDHFTICRPKSKNSNSFLHLVDFINYLLRER